MAVFLSCTLLTSFGFYCIYLGLDGERFKNLGELSLIFKVFHGQNFSSLVPGHSSLHLQFIPPSEVSLGKVLSSLSKIQEEIRKRDDIRLLSGRQEEHSEKYG